MSDKHTQYKAQQLTTLYEKLDKKDKSPIHPDLEVKLIDAISKEEKKLKGARIILVGDHGAGKRLAQ